MPRRPEALRLAAPADGADQLMREALFLGTYPGLTAAMLEQMLIAVREAITA